MYPKYIEKRKREKTSCIPDEMLQTKSSKLQLFVVYLCRMPNSRLIKLFYTAEWKAKKKITHEEIDNISDWTGMNFVDRRNILQYCIHQWKELIAAPSGLPTTE